MLLDHQIPHIQRALISLLEEPRDAGGRGSRHAGGAVHHHAAPLAALLDEVRDLLEVYAEVASRELWMALAMAQKPSPRRRFRSPLRR